MTSRTVQRPDVAANWTPAEYKHLIDRLLADLARARGLTVQQASMHYCLPDKPPMHRKAT